MSEPEKERVLTVKELTRKVLILEDNYGVLLNIIERLAGNQESLMEMKHKEFAARVRKR